MKPSEPGKTLEMVARDLFSSVRRFRDNREVNALHSGHKGQGHHAQVMETHCDDDRIKERTLNLITHVEVEPAQEYV